MFFGQILLNSLVLGTQVLLLAVPLYLVYSVSRIYHLALGASGMAAAYGLYFGLSKGWPLGLAIFLAIAVAVSLSLISYWLLESAARKKQTMLGLLISLALGIVIESLISIIFGTDAKSLVNGVLPIISWGALYITIPGVITILAGILLAIIFVLLINKTPWGRNLVGIAENDHLSASLNINASKIRCGVFIAAGLLAGFIGIMTVMNTALAPQTGFPLVILAFIALLIGGITDIRGTIIATYLIALIPELIINLSSSEWSLSTNWKMVIVFILAALVLIWRPKGLFISKSRVD